LAAASFLVFVFNKKQRQLVPARTIVSEKIKFALKQQKIIQGNFYTATKDGNFWRSIQNLNP